MIVPDTHVFDAGEIETGSNFNGTFTDVGNWMLGRPIFYGKHYQAQPIQPTYATGLKFGVKAVSRGISLNSADLTSTASATTFVSATSGTVTTIGAHTYQVGDSVTLTGFLPVAWNVVDAVITGVTATTFTFQKLGAGLTVGATQFGKSIVIPDNRINIETTGWYFVFGGAAMAGNITGLRTLQLNNSGTAPVKLKTQTNYTLTANAFNLPTNPCLHYFLAGTWVQLLLTQTSGAVLNANVLTDVMSSFGLIWVSN